MDPCIPRIRWGVLSVCALLAIGACDGDPAAPSDDGFDPGFAAEAVAGISNVIESTELEAIVGMISFTLAQDAGPGSTPPASRTGPYPARAALAGLAASSMPSQYLGKTLVYDELDRLYLVDPSRAGAPAGGVRFVVYEMDLDAGSPVVPLTEVGYLDVTVEGEDDSSLTLELALVSTTGASPVTLARYTTGFAVTEDASGTGVSLEAEGFVTDGTERVDFEVGTTFGIPAAGDVGTLTQGVAFEVVGAGIGYERTLELAFDLSTFVAVGDASYVTGVTADGQTLTLDLVIDEEDDLLGVVERNGVAVLTVGGGYASPVFRLPDGRSPSSSTQAAMVDLWTRTEALGDTGIRMTGPADALAVF